VPDLCINLFSFSQYTNHGYKIESGKLDMKDSDKNDKVYATVTRKKVCMSWRLEN